MNTRSLFFVPQRFFLSAACLALAAQFFLAPCALAWNPQPGQPQSALFYPGEVQVGVSERLQAETLPSGERGFLLALPEGVKRESFLLSVNGAAVGGFYWLDREETRAALAARLGRAVPGTGTVPENEPSPERRALLEAVNALADEQAGIQGQLAAAENRLALWQKSLEQYGRAASEVLSAPSPADEAAKLNEAYAAQYPVLHQDRETQRRALEDVGIRLREAQKNLVDFDRSAGIVLLAVPFAAEGEQALEYSYVLPAMSEISYRLDAAPDKGEVLISQDVALTQTSGFVWEKADVSLTTTRRDMTLDPRRIMPWIVTLAEKPKPAPRKSAVQASGVMPVPEARMYDAADKDMVARNQEYPLAQEAVMPAPVEEERATYRLWQIGPRRLESGKAARLALSAQACPAEFLYTLRPFSSPKGFLTAQLNPEKALDLPPGKARFSVDGAPVGHKFFTFSGDKGEVYFGSDPRVTVALRDMTSTSGQTGLFSKDQVRVRHWQFTLENSREKAVKALLEDAAPDVRDTAITLKMTSTPKPEQAVNPPDKGGAKVLRWSLTLEPGQSRVVDHKVELSAPVDKDKEFSSGR